MGPLGPMTFKRPLIALYRKSLREIGNKERNLSIQQVDKMFPGASAAWDRDTAGAVAVFRAEGGLLRSIGPKGHSMKWDPQAEKWNASTDNTLWKPCKFASLPAAAKKAYNDNWDHFYRDEIKWYQRRVVASSELDSDKQAIQNYENLISQDQTIDHGESPLGGHYKGDEIFWATNGHEAIMWQAWIEEYNTFPCGYWDGGKWQKGAGTPNPHIGGACPYSVFDHRFYSRLETALGQAFPKRFQDPPGGTASDYYDEADPNNEINGGLGGLDND